MKCETILTTDKMQEKIIKNLKSGRNGTKSMLYA